VFYCPILDYSFEFEMDLFHMHEAWNNLLSGKTKVLNFFS